jgi:hypothetical protein
MGVENGIWFFRDYVRSNADNVAHLLPIYLIP